MLGAKATCSRCKPGRGDVQRVAAGRQFGCHSSQELGTWENSHLWQKGQTTFSMVSIL